MEITSVEKNKKNKNRMSVFVDGKFSFTISEEDYISLNLYEQTVLTQDTMDYIKNTLNYRDAKAIAIRYLSLKLRTEKEVLDKLAQEGYESSCAEQVIEDLKSIGYINNTLYAQKYVFDRSKLKPKSKKLLKQELQARGISTDIADQVLDDWKVDDLVIAGNLLKRKFGKYDLFDESIQKKATLFLLHRGFSYDTIREAFHSVSEDNES